MGLGFLPICLELVKKTTTKCACIMLFCLAKSDAANGHRLLEPNPYALVWDTMF